MIEKKKRNQRNVSVHDLRKRKLKLEKIISMLNSSQFFTDAVNYNFSKINEAKKIVIKNSENWSTFSENYLENTWEKLEKTLIAILTSKSIMYSLEELYQAVENICNDKTHSQLYSKLYVLIETHVKSIVEQLLEDTTDELVYLKKVINLWQNYCHQISMARKIFLYFDRTYMCKKSTIHSLWDMGLDLFRKHIALNKVVQKRIVEYLLLLITKERNGDMIDRTIMKNLINMLCDLDIYQMIFERKFLIATKKFYLKEGQRKIQELDIPEYLLYVEKRLAEENERLLHYLYPSTRKKLINLIENTIIVKHLEAILKKGFDNLFEENRLNDLKRLYLLFNRFENGSTKLCTYFNMFIKKKGQNIIIDPKKDKNMIQNLLDFKLKLDKIINTCFEGKEKFHNSLRDAFEFFINEREKKSAELLAKYVDKNLRIGNKEATDEELDQIFDRVMVLFRYVYEKDVFEICYRKNLAKRLLISKSASIDAEKSMLLKLKQECGSEFTSKLEGMFRDIELSKDINLIFKQHTNNMDKIDLIVNVLTMGIWPTYSTTDVTIPPQLVKLQADFNKFYLTEYYGRTLQWRPELGHCVLRAFFKQGLKELHVSFFQAFILLLFNDRDVISFDEIKSETNIECNELKRTLQSLACGKIKVLLKIPKGKDVYETDRFRFNQNLTNKLFKIKINQIQIEETDEEHKTIEKQVTQNRQYRIDAAIVRIMKMQKTLIHNSLISELYKQLKFRVKPVDFKRRIESLIARDYIKRDKNNQNLYNYVA